MLKSNRELFEAFNVLDTTWKKWSREFLPEDPEAGLRKGKTRMYTAEQAFLVWAGGQMLNSKNMTYEESREALNALSDYMEDKGYFPLCGTEIESRDRCLLSIHRMSGSQTTYQFSAGINPEITTETFMAVCTVNILLDLWIFEFCKVWSNIKSRR